MCIHPFEFPGLYRPSLLRLNEPGVCYEVGHWGFDTNPQEATRWYREMQKCVCRDSIGETREMAAAWLREAKS